MRHNLEITNLIIISTFNESAFNENKFYFINVFTLVYYCSAICNALISTTCTMIMLRTLGPFRPTFLFLGNYRQIFT
jgi:hypothetical protein